jgi:hypothetical protein
MLIGAGEQLPEGRSFPDPDAERCGPTRSALKRKALRRTARPRRALGTILVLLGMLLWMIATLSLIPFEPSLGIISGGMLVVGGVILIATSV